MRRYLFTVAAVLALAAPALADELSDAKAAIAAAKLSAKTDMIMWCAAAFGLAEQLDADGPAKKTDGEVTTILFAKGTPMMTSEGVAAANLTRLTQDYVAVAKSELVDGLGTPQHTQDECLAAAKN